MLGPGVEAGSAEAEAAKKAVPNPPCVALNAHLRLFPNGDVPTCQFNTKKAGNLRQQSFEELWFGAKTEVQRDWVRKCPGCWAECEVLPSAIYTGELARAAVMGR
jgi:MoaA/NifB/PqqE/SkfB family radical SAM enzyme